MFSVKERFWLEDPSIIFQSGVIIPRCNMSIIERLNALTRLILLITLFLLLFCFREWWLFLLLGLILVLVLYYLECYQWNQTPLIENYVCKKDKRPIKVCFSPYS